MTIIEEIFSRLGSAGFWLDAAILTAIIRFVWSVVQKGTETLIFQLALRTRTIDIAFDAHPDTPKEIEAVKYLLIRYGNDKYLQELASDQEKFHGRLRNRIKPVTVVEEDDGGKRVSLQLKVHKRLGTQFTLFVDVIGDTDPVVRYLESHDTVTGVAVSARPGAKRKRVFFRLKDYPEIETVDGFRNNMIFPV